MVSFKSDSSNEQHVEVNRSVNFYKRTLLKFTGGSSSGVELYFLSSLTEKWLFGWLALKFVHTLILQFAQNLLFQEINGRRNRQAHNTGAPPRVYPPRTKIEKGRCCYGKHRFCHHDDE